MMSGSVANTCPYYSKYDTPTLTSRFHKAIFNGRTTKVEQLIAAGENVYASTDKDEIPLFIAIVRNHLTIVNKIIDIYEDDLCFVRNFFRNIHHIEWTHRNVFIAHDTDHIHLVEELSKGMEILPGQRRNAERGMIVLLKSPSERKVLWLSPNSHDDDIRIAKIVKCVWADGVIDLQHTGHWGRTLLDAAAIRCLTETYCRLFPLAQTEPNAVIEHFLQLCRYHADKLEYFKELYSRTGCHFDIADVILNVPKVLALPAYYDDQIEIFQYFLECLADKTATNEDRQATMAGILNTFKAIEPSALIETIVWADVKEFVEQCLVRFKPNLFSIMANNETVLEALIWQKPSTFMTQFIIDHFEVVLANGMECTIVKCLISQNWLDAVKQLYERYPSTRSVLFRDKSEGVQSLLGAIDACRYDLATFLIDAHRLQLTDPDDVLRLILSCSFVQRSYTLLEMVLSLPVSDPLRITGPDDYFKSPMYVALKYRHLKNYQLLLDQVSDVAKLRDIREDNGENLLFPAIWFKENPVDETPFVYVPEEMASIEIVDSSDDEDEPERKRIHNERLFTSSGPIRDPIMPDSFFVEQRAEVNRIFDHLLIELALDAHCVNNSGETLLHLAVKRDNYHVLKQLLSLGLDVHAKDNDGNFPMHGVCSTAVLNALLEHKCDVNVTNLAGETPLMVFAKGLMDSEDTAQNEDDEFIAELIRKGASIQHSDPNGLTALHLVKSVKAARALLLHGASINARNAEGETPLLYIFRQQAGSGPQSLYKLFLCHDDLDVKVVSTNKSSILPVLIALDENSMTDVLATFNQRTRAKDLDDLFIEHCNGVDQYDYPLIASSFSEHTNSYCLQKFLSLRELDVNVHLEYPLLQLAVHDEHIVRRLIERGANVNGVGNPTRKTPLMYSVEKRQMANDTSNFNSTQLLLSAGADVTIDDENGDTALNYACRLEDRKIARRTIAALILANADYYRRNGENGKLPLLEMEPFKCFYDRGNN